MDYKSITEFVKAVQKKEIDIVEHTQKVIQECKEINKEYHYFNVITEELALEQAKAIADNPKPMGKLAGVAVSVKDCICVKGVETRSGSKILSGYEPVFNATVIQKVIDEGAIIIGKTAQDEFGFGGFSVNVGVDFPVPLNPIDKDRSCGGSSGGAGGISRLASFPHIALAESTGGSIASPAAYCGVPGLCPTYGRVSRYGLLDFGNSLDKIGPIAKSVHDIALMMEIISGHDTKESTSLDKPVDDYTKFLGKDVKGMKIGVIKESFDDVIEKPVQNAVKTAVQELESMGAVAEEVSIPVNFRYGVPVYFLLATTEASTNLAKFCGMRYGQHDEVKGKSFNEYFSEIRSKNFGKEAKRRVMLGTFGRMAGYRDAYYIKAAQVRTMMIREFKDLFGKYDALVCPVTPILAPTFDEVRKLTLLQEYMIDQLTTGVNLCGMPHMGITVGYEDKNKLPLSVMLIADHLEEKKLIQVASALEKLGEKS